MLIDDETEQAEKRDVEGADESGGDANAYYHSDKVASNYRCGWPGYLAQFSRNTLEIRDKLHDCL
jgi:peptide methionine sulfoxide reductase MsrB